MSNELNGSNATTRRAFIQRTSLAALATAGAATALLGTPDTALACTPIPPWLRPEIYQKLVDTFRPVEDLTKKWIKGLGDETMQMMGLFAFRYFIDDYCGTYPRKPPFGPRPQFIGYETKLANIKNAQSAVFAWGDGSVRLGVPSIIAISILRDDVQAGLLLPAQPTTLTTSQATAERVRLWRPWFPC
jgi:hypothetical protein